MSIKTFIGIKDTSIKSVSNAPVGSIKTILGSGLNPLPATFTLTSTGTGAGVSTLRLWVTKDITLTLDGTARFYDDSAGTTNEGTSRTVVAGGMRTFYLKCPSGTANLVFSDVRNLVRWGDNMIDGWASSTNAASIAGSIESLMSLTYLRVDGNNTLSGSVAGLTDLTYLRVQGSNTLSGSVAGLKKLTFMLVLGSNTLSGSVAALTSLTNLSILGSNTLSGSVAGLTDLTILSVAGSNTLSGSVAGLTDLTILSVAGSNTLSGSVAGLTDLTILSVAGSNTLSGDIGVNNMVNGITTFNLTGNNQMDTYTAGAVWSNTAVTINPAAGYGYDSTEIDNILIDIANSAGGPSGKTITLQGSSQPRTSASDAAVATLQARGCTIITN